jgi:hypothetical protein
MPADCSRKTNGPALPSMIGISGPATSMWTLSIPSPASADIMCSTVEIAAPSCLSVDERRVSPTCSASAGIAIGRSRSTRWKTMPALGAAGRSTSSTRAPVCRPTPVVLIVFFSVRCLIMPRAAVEIRARSMS